MRRVLTGAVLACAVAATLTACVHDRTTTVDVTDTTTHTVSRSAGPTGPVDTRKVVASDAPACPFLSAADAADLGGMRLARTQQLKQGATVVGCRFFAIQGSYLAASEHLPGPDQPVIEIRATRYASALDAHNALALAATKGSDQDQYDVVAGVVGVAYRTTFDREDGPRDWAFGFDKGATLVVVSTARYDNSYPALQLAQAIYPRI